ncbi:MAG: PqqD family protein [Oscillospiraceae bacterium]|nr:PqqD family protein [Oscillospiraceae bacterium]
MGRKEKRNYLDYIPVRSPKHEWTLEENGRITVHMVHDGIWDRIAQKFFHRPRISHIQLDELGSFVWQQIDGQKTVGQIAENVKEAFGEKAEPLYNRLVQYLKILYNNGLIRYQAF